MTPEQIAEHLVCDIHIDQIEREICRAIAQARRDGAESALALVAERLREVGDDIGFRVVCNTENPCAEPKEPAHDDR